MMMMMMTPMMMNKKAKKKRQPSSFLSPKQPQPQKKQQQHCRGRDEEVGIKGIKRYQSQLSGESRVIESDDDGAENNMRGSKMQMQKRTLSIQRRPASRVVI